MSPKYDRFLVAARTLHRELGAEHERGRGLACEDCRTIALVLKRWYEKGLRKDECDRLTPIVPTTST